MANRDEPRQRSAGAPSDTGVSAFTAKLSERSNAQDTATPATDAWIVRIRELYDEGKLTEATQELAALRAAAPDADRRLPPELRTSAATVEP